MATPAAQPAPAAPATPASSSTDKAAAAQALPKEPEKPAEKIRVRGYERAKQLKAKFEAEDEGKGDEDRDTDSSEKPKPKPEPKKAATAEKADEKKQPPAKAEPAKTREEPTEKPEPKKTEAVDEEEDPAAKRRAERQERLRKAAERERQEQAERVAQSRSKQQTTALEREVETLRKKLSELEPLSSVFASEEALLAEAERRNMSAEKLVTWMRTRMSDPAAVASHHAKTEADKLRDELKAVQKRIDDAEEQRRQERAQYQAEQEGMHRAMSFLGRAKESTESHPLTAALQARYGDKGLVEFANQFVAPMLSESYSIEELHDHVEELLERVQVGASLPGTPASTGKSHPSKNGADQPPTTLSNRATQGRGSVTEEIPLHRMPKRDRFQMLREKYGRE